jgi:hypothetical protein
MLHQTAKGRVSRLAIILLAASVLATPVLAAPKWTALFNGKNLDNFDIAYSSKPVDGRPANALFEVRNGEVHTYPGQPAGSLQPAAYFQTRDEHSNYVLHIEYKWGGKKFAPRMQRLKDAGLVFHTYENVENSWPHGIECQIEESDVGDLWIISAQADVATKTALYKPSPDPLQNGAPYYAPDGQVATHGDRNKYVRIRHSAEVEKPGWNSVEVVVRGDSAVYLVNGQVAMRIAKMKKWDSATNGWLRLDRGKILFQAEFAEVFYRNIKIRPALESDPK